MALLQHASAEPLGPVLRQDGYQFSPPQAFHAERMDLFHGTWAGAISLAPQSPRYLSVALVDRAEEDAATLSLSIIEEPFSLGPSSRDHMTTAVVRHFRDVLDVAFQLERSEIHHGRVEVFGAIRQGSQLRRIWIVAWPHARRHVVALCSVPSGRWEALEPTLRRSLDTMRLDEQSGFRPPQWILWVLVMALGALLATSMRQRRRRAATRE